MKKFITILSIVTFTLTLTIASYAASYRTPAEITAELTGKTVEEVWAERESGKSYGTIAKEANKLDELQDAMLKNKKTRLNDRVEAGILSQEEADAFYSRMEERQALCDGAGYNADGYGCGGGGFRSQGMMRRGNGQGFGRGMRAF